MGLGLRVAASLGKVNALATMAKLQRALAQHLSQSELAPIAKIAAFEGAPQLNLHLHPAEEPVEFWIDGSSLVCSAQTSAAGPGYHHFVIELLDAVASDMTLAWIWASEKAEPADETGFAEHRDFARLQIEMAGYLREVARLLIERSRAGSSQFRLSMTTTMSQAIVGKRFADLFALSPTGPWNRDYFESIANAHDRDLPALVSQFMPWWNRGFTGATWFGLARVLLWMEFPWRSPLDQSERSLCDFIIACIESAERKGIAGARTQLNFDELSKIRGSGTRPVAPRSDGIGYKRDLMELDFSGGWTVIVPGYFSQETEKNGATLIYSFGDIVVRGSNFAFERKPNSRLGDILAIATLGTDDVFEVQGTNFVGRANIKRVNDRQPYWLLEGRIETLSSVLVITITFAQDTNRDQCIEFFRSVRPPRPDAVVGTMRE